MSIGTLGDGDDRRTQIITRLGEIHREMGERVAEIEALQRELQAHPAGEESPEQKRRKFFLIPGGLAALIAAIRATPAHATRGAHTVAVATAGFAGGAVLTAATIGVAAAPPHAVPPPAPPPAPSATLGPHTPPARRAPHRSLPPTPIIPGRRRSPAPSTTPTTPAGPPTPGPSPASVLPPLPAPLRSPAPSASPSCMVLVEAGRIITVCL